MYSFTVNVVGSHCRRRANTASRCRWTASTSGSRGSRLVVIGLGNPGNEFTNTRHNVGFEVIDLFAKRHGGSMRMTPKYAAETCEVPIDGKTVMLVKPMTFMNLSGTTVRKIVEFYKLPFDAFVVVTDDIHLELGRLRLRGKGSSGGHNGLKHIEKSVGTQIYPRLRVGVGGPGYQELRDYVLGKFKRSEADKLDEVLWDCMDLLDTWVKEPDLGKVMNALSAKK